MVTMNKGPRRVSRYNSPAEVGAAKAAEGITPTTEKRRTEEKKANNFKYTSEQMRRKKNW